jgi:hypothetical protein
MRCRTSLWLGLALLVLSSSLAAADLRTWSDATGQFKIEAKFVGEQEGTVTLQQADGTELEIELKALSAADQKMIANLKKMADNPFKPKAANPFTVKGKGAATPGTTKAAVATGSSEPRVVPVDWTNVESVSTAAPGDDWQLEIAPVELELPANLRPVPLPQKSNFFEGLKTLAVNPVARKVVAGYLLGEPKPQGTVRLTICDLTTGRATNPAVTQGMLVPIALHDDGQHVVMRREEFGFGNHDRLEFWQVTGSRVQKLVSWTPYDNLRGGQRDIQWAAFLDAEQLVTCGGGGELAVWSFPDMEPLYRAPLGIGGQPALSPDRKWIAFSDGQHVGLFDVERRELVAQQATPASLHAPRLAFSPSGRRLACIAQSKLLVWDVANGNLLQDMDVHGIHIFTGIDFPHENYVLGGNKFLIDIENQLKVWTYEGHDQVATIGEWTLFGVMDSRKPGALLAAKLPHRAATDLQKKAASDPSLFLLRPGTKVKLDVAGIADAAQKTQVTKDLAERLRLIDCTADPAGTLTLSASIEGPKQQTLSLRNAGDYQVQAYTSRVQILHEGKPLWQTSSTNVPGGPVIFFDLKEGENIGTWLKKREKPDYTLFSRVELPKYLQKPAPNATSPTGSLTLGTSRMTTAGIP